MRINSGILDNAVVESELQAIPAILHDMNVDTIEAMFGWGCDVPLVDLYHPFNVPVSELNAFVQSQGKRLGFLPGASDLFLSVSDERLKIHFCHDGDIHAEGSDEKLVEAIESHWRLQAFPGCRWANGEWIPFNEWFNKWIHGDVPQAPAALYLNWTIDVSSG